MATQETNAISLDDLRPVKGSRRNRKRVGRGRASGHGKTSTRGHNGQGQRSGEGKRFGFEGGQTPLFRRLPKIHNFDEVITREWIEVNVGALNTLPADSEVNPESLVQSRILRKVSDSLRILGNGELKVALKVKAHHFSKGARAKIEAAGGSAEVIPEAPRGPGKRKPKEVKAHAAGKPTQPAKAEGEEGGKAAKADKKEKGKKEAGEGAAPEKKADKGEKADKKEKAADKGGAEAKSKEKKAEK